MAVQTVLGRIDGSLLGRTLTHEHFLLDYRAFHVPPPQGLHEFLHGEITLENVGFVQRYPYSSLSNVSFFTDDVKAAVLYDVALFRRFGGGTIVENTTHGLKRDVNFLREVSQSTQVHVVAGTGYYLASTQDGQALNLSGEEMQRVMREELTVGCLENGDVKCGFLGEIASDYPIAGFERRVIQAVGEVQERLKCPASFHPGRNAEAPAEILRLYAEAGGDPAKSVVSHLERTLTTPEQFLSLADEFKCLLQQDLFGTEVLVYQFDPQTQMPADADRIRTLKILIENGLEDRILISHDIHTKHRLVRFGGHGYCHLMKNVIPKMSAVGISHEMIDKITIHNPRNWLTWNCP